MYNYQALDPARKEFRLLNIDAFLSSDGLIQCSLIHCELANAPVYTALSYTW